MTALISVLSNLKVAGALVIDRDIAEFPLNPKIGTLVIKDQNLYAYISLPGGMETWYPLVRDSSATYVHTQGIESTIWTVNHNLNTSDLWYQIKDVNGEIVSPASFEVITFNSFRLTFSEGIVGTVVVVGTNVLEITSMKAQIIEVGDSVRIDTSGLKIDGLPVITGTTMTIGDGVDPKITYTDTQQLNIVGGTGIEVAYDDVTKKITLAAPGSSVTPTVLNDAINAAVTSEAAARVAADASLQSATALKLDATEVTTVATANKVLRLDATAKLAADITGNAATASSVEFVNVQNKPTTLAGYGITDAGAPTGSLTVDFAAKTLTVADDILPAVSATELGGSNIGSPTQRFKGIYVDEAHLSVNTLYLGDTAVMGTEADTINIKADAGQSINIKTLGVGTTLVTSERGITMSATGSDADVLVQATGVGSQVRLTAVQSIELNATAVDITGNSNISGNQTVGGGLTVTGSLVVNGSTTTVNSTTVTTKDNIILVNQGQVGSGVSAGKAGLSVDRGDEPVYQMVFDETDDMFKVGMVGSLQTIASQPFVMANSAPIVHNHDVATTTVSGFMSATDKVKLNNAALIENTYTQAEVQALITSSINDLKSRLYSYS